MTRKRDTRTPEEREHAELVERSQRHDARMNETMSRRDILEAIEDAIDGFGGGTLYGTDTVAVTTLRALREAFE